MADSSDRIFQTFRCVLRPAQMTDLSFIEQGVSHESFPRLLPLSALQRRGGLAGWLRRCLAATDRVHLWAVDTKSGQQCIGQVCLTRLEDDVTWSLAFWLAPPYWGRGLAHEVVEACLARAFEQLQISRVLAGVAKWNERSNALLKTLGFQQTGESEAGYSIDGQHQPVFEYSLTAAVWATRFSP
jgi:ribosomal-protein-alanine N-acetyltransferase